MSDVKKSQISYMVNNSSKRKLIILNLFLC